MLDLKDIHFFLQVADRKGFSAASETLGVNKSTLSLRIKGLESSLGVRLINRTPRQFLLTEVGTEFYRYAADLLKNAEAAEEAIRQRLAEPSGVVRIALPMEVSQYLLRGILPVYLNKYPKVTIQESVTDRFVDIVGEGFDIAIRGHSTCLPDSDLVHRPLAKAPWHLFASPGYIKRMPVLEGPEQLGLHSVVSLAGKGLAQWQMQGPEGQQHAVSAHSRYRSNNLVSLKEAACADLGIAALPGYICRSEIAAGTLRPVLPGWIASDARFTVLFPHRAGLLPAVRSLVDFLAQEFPILTAFE